MSNRQRLMWSAYRIVGASDAEDVVQDAYERAWRSSSFRTNAELWPWLSRIVRNAAFDALQRRRRREAACELRLDVESAESAVLRSETCAALAGALGTLPAVQRRVILLHDVAGYSSREIAVFCGIGYNTVRTRLFRARRAMRRVLDRHTQPPA